MSSDKLDMQSVDGIAQNVEKIAALFPNCVTETAEGLKIDFDQLQQELSADIVEGAKERYRLDWPGKREAIVTANLPTTHTLRPVREDSVDFDTTENIYIEGDNLEVLKILQESYLNKIKMIYIDPPYNTGKDFVYKDNFAVDAKEWKEAQERDEQGNRLVPNPEGSGRYHSDWLTMMYPRLKLARNLLTEDGMIFISIDDNEVHNLRKMCDEIFGEGNFINALIWNKQHSQQQGFIKRYHETVLVYSKNIHYISQFIGGEGEITAGALKKISKANPASDFLFPKGTRVDSDTNFVLRGEYGGNEKVIVAEGEFICENGRLKEDVTLRAGWTQKSQMSSWFNNQETYDTKGQKVIEFYFSSTGKLKCRKERSTVTPSTILPKFGMNSLHSENLKLLMGGAYFDNPKPIDMIKMFIGWIVRGKSIVLDFFSGSATTAHATMQLNAEDGGKRKYIMVQLPEETDEKSEAYKAGYKNICEIGKERIRRAARKIKEEKADKARKEGVFADFEDTQDYGFRVYRLDSSNMKDIFYKPHEFPQTLLDNADKNVKEDRSAEDLLTQIILDWGLPLSLPVERKTIHGKEVFAVAGNSLYACFDSGIDEDFAKEVAKDSPLRIVFKDSGFKDDTAKENVRQLLKQLSAETDMKVI